MPEEQATQVEATPTQTAPADQTTGASDSQAGDSASGGAAAYDWASEIEKIDPEQIRRHPRVAGIVGDMLNREKTRWQTEQEQAIKQREAEDASARLRKLAEDDPVEFSRQYLTQAQQQKIQRDLAGLKGQTRQEMAGQIRSALEGLPEFKELSQEDTLDIARAIAGKPDDEVLGAFNLALLEKVSEKRLVRRFDEWKTKELAKERSAIRQEEAAKLMKREKGPDMTRPAGEPARVDLSKIADDAEFNRRYETEVLEKRARSRYR